MSRVSKDYQYAVEQDNKFTTEITDGVLTVCFKIPGSAR
jgi:hypothetical protein